MRLPLINIILIITSLLSSAIANAEQSMQIGAYTVHYIAVNSSFIDPDIANEYGIVRGDRRAFLNISVLKNESDGSTTPVTAIVNGGKKNLFGQVGKINFIEISEGEAIYYIGQFEFSNADNIKFTVDLQPEANGRTYAIEWSTRLYNN